MSQTSVLVFFAEEFSTSKAEQFIEHELVFLSNHFEKIVVIPIRNNIQDCKYILPENVQIQDFEIYKPYNRIRQVFKNSGLLFKVVGHQIYYSENKLKYFSKFSTYFNYLLHACNVAERIQNEVILKYGVNVKYYSYWFNIWVFYLSLVKDKSNIKIITRAHGGDYDESQTKSFFPFRSFQMKHIDVILPVSKYGENYLKQKYPFTTARIKNVYLGVKNMGNNPVNVGDVFTMVSCSSIIPLKRVALIPQILSGVKFKLNWIHFGDGTGTNELLNEIKKLPCNVTFELKGHVPNEYVIDFYRKNHVDLVINVSESEGVPVSLMEAISFGIPVIGTNVCGVPEIVTTETGFLIPKDFIPAEVSEIIIEYAKSSPENKLKLRRSAKEYWRNKFDLERNCEMLKTNYLN